MPHLLKRLEYRGFKSFAEKTVFDFPEGITAIVGPNGSGKSNIIDGIRWLLGERDAKSLRGGKSEDLIFGGTANRPRLGQAEASLYFDNVGGFFPVDFAEVVVSRKVNRDGTNQYYLNNSEVRLKDLVDFFAQARLGARGLVVITQGNSDMFIRVTPRERREMIEEMLGLREYELKRAEAERRLTNTQINLDKVRALTEEILPHLRSLKRQTSRWEKRAGLEEELRSLENHVFGSTYHELHEGMTRTDADIAAREKDGAGLLSARTAAETHLKDVEASQPKEREELLAIKKQTRELLDERNALEKEMGKLEVQIEMSSRAVAVQQAPGTPTHEALHSLTKNMRSALSSLSYESIDALRTRIGALIEEIDQVMEAKSHHASSVPRPPAHEEKSAEEIQKTLKGIHERLSTLQETITTLTEKERTLEKSQEEFYTVFKKALAELDGAKQAIDRWESARRELGFARERLTLRMDEWKRQVEQAGRKEEEFAHLGRAAAGDASFGHASSSELEHRMFKLRGDLASIGEVDQGLIKEAQETETRYEFLNRETADLEKARDDLRAMIVELSEKIKVEFDAALLKINKELGTFFELMFGGGHAELVRSAPKVKKTEADEAREESALGTGELEVKDAVEMPKEEQHTPEGIEINVKLPKKRITSLEMLSGGERSLVGIAALFALISVSPPPFLVLDEVDAPLDERNARRFADMLKKFSKETQFILVTHNRATMEAANMLYGMTMNDDGTSKVVSLKLEEYGPAA
jgi:chromosome segregation ATPase